MGCRSCPRCVIVLVLVHEQVYRAEAHLLQSCQCSVEVETAPPLFYKSGFREKVANASRAEPSDKVCETANAQASLKSATCKHFGFPVPGNEKGEKVSDRQTETRMQTLLKSIEHISTSPFSSVVLSLLTAVFPCLGTTFYLSAQSGEDVCGWVCLKHTLHLSPPSLLRR